MQSVNKLLLVTITTALISQALPVQSRGFKNFFQTNNPFSTHKITFDVQATGPAQIFELEANQKYILQIKNLPSNAVQTYIKSEKDIDERINIEDRLVTVHDRSASHILTVKDVVEPFVDILLLQTYTNGNGKYVEGKNIPIRITIKSQTACGNTIQPVCGKLFFSPIDIAEKTFNNKCEAKRAGAKFISNKQCSK